VSIQTSSNKFDVTSQVVNHCHSIFFLFTDTSVCYGDSGGGLVVQGPKNRYYLQGVVSIGQVAIEGNQRSCRSERRALFTNVTKYLEGPNYWIQEQMQRLHTTV